MVAFFFTLGVFLSCFGELCRRYVEEYNKKLYSIFVWHTPLCEVGPTFDFFCQTPAHSNLT
jgi:hypothetical protein